MNLIVPQNLDIVNLINEYFSTEQCNFSPKEKKLWRGNLRLEKLLLLVTLIRNRHIHSNYRDSDYVPLNAKLQQKMLGTRYAARCLDLLIKLRVIEERVYFKYKVGVEPKHFKLTKNYLGVSGKKVGVVPKSGEWEDSCKTFYKGQYPIHDYLFGCLKRITLSPDWDQHQASLNLSPYDDERMQSLVQRIKTTNPFFTHDRFGRIYTNITMLYQKKEDAKKTPIKMRDFLMIDGVQAMETDVHATHPFLCLALYKPGESEEMNKYAKLFGEDFYSDMGICIGKGRGEVKKIWLKEIINISSPKTDEAKKMWESFSAAFPILAARFKEKKKNDYRGLCYLILKLEAKIMISKAGQMLANRKIPFATVHDSIIHKPSDLEAVIKCLTKAFKDETGFAPKLTHSPPQFVT